MVNPDLTNSSPSAALVPMSATQQGIYFDTHLRTPADYHVALHLRVLPVEPERVVRALIQVMSEQPALRSAVRHDRDGLSFAISETVDAPHEHHDLREGGTAALDNLMRQATETGFPLERAPLFRVLHCQLEEEDHLVLACHHLIADGQSVSLLAERLLSLALADEDDAENLVDEGFEKYQLKQAEVRATQKMAKAEAFWHENLAKHDAPDLGHWLKAAPLEAVGREIRVPLEESLQHAVRTAAQDADVSEFAFYLGAFGHLLAQYAHADEVSVAVPFTDRPGWEMENSVGCFVKTLPVRIDVRSEQTLGGMLERLGGEIRDTWRHLAYPQVGLFAHYPALAEVYDITFIQDTYPSLPEGVLGKVGSERVQFPGKLTVLVEQIGARCELVFQFKESALSAEQVTLLAQRYKDLLTRMPLGLNSQVSNLQPITQEERDGLLPALSQTHRRDWEPAHLGIVFLKKTSNDPTRIAWSDARREYTNAWAHDAAVVMQRHVLAGAGAEKQPIIICLPRSADLLAAIFGTVLTGSSYIPLSPDIPQQRLSQIIADAGVRVVLTTSDTQLPLPEDIIRLDVDRFDDLDVLRADPRPRVQEEPIPVDLRHDDVLYIEYTSGSTGVPKGVVIRHDNIQNTALDLEHLYPLRADDVYLLKTSFTFDIFGTEIYGWLMGQGRLAILPVGEEGDPLALLSAIRDAGITHVNFSPTMLRALLDAASRGRSADLAGLAWVFSGGEALTSDIVRQFFSLDLACSLENVYGPTEASMWATQDRVSAADDEAIAPVGRPLNDYRLYVVHPSGDLCGVELPGEICIAGAGVAVGYLNRDELNAAQFVDNPFYDPLTDPEHMRRMYRTGDLGYLRADGRFAFIRRNDRQVKVGGVRIELGEIEQALLQADGVASCAVIIDDTTTPSRLVGFYTSARSLATEPIRATLGQLLTPQQVPSRLVQLDVLPTNAAGKLDRRALVALLADLTVDASSSAPEGPLQQRIANLWSTVLDETDIDVEVSYFAQGGNSLNLMRLQHDLQEEFGREIRITDLLSHHTVAAQAGLFEEIADKEQPAVAAAPIGQDIAIIGIGAQVPGADDVHGFWENLLRGQESITFYSDEELRALGIPEADLRDPNYVPASGRLDGVGFDDVLFGIAPAEAEATSPQLRLLYECFWKACEDAGYDPRALPGRVGAFVGGNDDFAWYAASLLDQPSFSEAYQNFTLATNHFLATRLSYYFDLTGPSLAALAGCSTSLLTVHLAVQSLRAGECEIAVAGGVTLESPNEGGYHYAEGMMLSPDGHCRPFDADARGTVFSNGAALLVLKPVAAALRDGDPIYAVIKGSGVSNDGRRKLSYTAPSEDGQHEAMRTAYDVSGIDPSTVTYVEAHGTGTLLGDPVEVASLTRAFAGSTAGSCVLGSVKGNVGHTDSAAGAVGLSKVALSLKHRYLPGTCNYRRPNPNVDFAATPFRVSGTGQRWVGDQLRAGVNSFGVGGTNVHVILEEAPDVEKPISRNQELMQFSAASPEALDRGAERVVRYLAEHAEVPLGDAARTLRRGRAQLPYRKAMVLDPKDLRDADAWVRQLGSTPMTQAQDRRRVALLLSGQGNQHQGMGLGLYNSDSGHGNVFRHWMDQLTGFLSADDATTFRAIIHGDEDDERIHHTEWAQFALFSTQFATVKALEFLGVRANVLVGHSIGELTAAALAGVWTPEAAARLVRERGRLMQAQEPGIMIAVAAPVDRVRSLIEDLDNVWVSLDNSAQRCVLGMTKDAFGGVIDRLEDEGIHGTRLHTSHAFHTPMMTEAAAAFEAVLAGVESRDPSLPIISNRSGRAVQPGEMTRPDYWSRHITDEVRFADSLAGLLADETLLGVEIGPGASLSTFAAQDPARGPGHVFVNVLRHAADPTSDDAHLLGALGTLWGAGLRRENTPEDDGRRVSLPGYAFDRSLSLPRTVSAPARPHATTPQAPSTPGDVLPGICDAFRHVLGHREITPDADFFRLGGDSLKAAALSAHLKRTLGLQVGVADVFSMPTPAALAESFHVDDVTTALSKAPHADDYPLSPAQTRMYLAARLDPAGLGYNMASATLLRGELEPQRVHLALSRLVERHAPLRTTFSVRDGALRQRVASSATAGSQLPLRFTTSHSVAGDNRDERMNHFVRPFDLAEGPLFRMEIVDQGEAGSLLLFDIHHIIADGTSVEILTRDFSLLYVDELEPLNLQYPDFAVHVTADQHRASLTETTDQLVDSLRDAPTADVLVVDPPQGQRTSAAGRVGLRLDAERLADVRALAQQHNATPFMVALSVWGAVLARYTTGDDLVIGVPVSGRTMSETQEMVGMFVNLLPVRLRPEAATTFDDYLAGTRGAVLEALSRQEVPFEDVVDRLGAGGGTGRHPLCSISFDYQNLSRHDLEMDGVAAEPLEVSPLAVGMDLVITCYEEDDSLSIHLDHASDLVERSTVEQLAHHFTVLLDRICRDATLQLGTIPLYSDADHADINARLLGGAFTPVHESISERAADSPDDIAIINVDGRSFSHAALDGMANAQAKKLAAAGLTPGEHVAVFSTRDVNLFVAQLAILKAGGAYVLFDLTQPSARHESILADLAPRFCFAVPGSQPGISTTIDIRTCTQDSCDTFDAPNVVAEDPIYTVYTSGSTGAPKGITVRHRGVANLLSDHRDRDIFGPGDVIISLASPAFDIFTFESLLPLASGAGVHLCSEDDAKDAFAIAGHLDVHDVTHIQVPVSKMSALCGNRRFRAQLSGLKVIVCGGEHFPHNLLEVLQTESDARIFNMYGPSETTVTATVKEFAAGDSVTIGTPVRGCDVLVVNEAGMIQPHGISGELCIAGQGVAAGYSNNPDETARKFTTITELPGLRMYRTGDLGLQLGNGELVINGRADHQVKLHGNRVELGEVEKTAMRVDGVTYAVAAATDDDLILYYSATPGPCPEAAITSEIARTLPSYMSPQSIHKLDAMPILPNGKVDRKSLEVVVNPPSVGDPGSAAAPEAPNAIWIEPTIVAEILAAWEEVLGHAAQPDDNFFDVGGNSYKLMLVNNRLGVTFDTDVPLVRLFEHPTPRLLAHAIVDVLGPDVVAAPVPDLQVSTAISLTDVEGFAPWPEENGANDRGQIAVIGVAGVFPGAATVEEHWANRFRGQVDISSFSRADLLAGGADAATLDDPRYVNARGHVAADTFDADFFGYSTHEAETMDPQLRLLHETTWRAMEDAGYVPGAYPGDIALFAGSGTNFAWMASFLNRVDDPTGAFEAMTMNEKDFLTTKVAYKLGLTGPAVTVQTACSTSLVAIHEAVQCLRHGGADMALAGGVALNFPRKEGYSWREGMIFSADGVCRPFSGDANGTVAGQGCGVVLLKPLGRARADGDHIYAVVSGSAINNDGRSKVGYTAPSVQGQQDVVRAALADADVHPDEIGYVETHGTGTELGDPIEYSALSAVYGRQDPCALGAAKGNIGHLDAAAGVAGFLGAVGVLHHGKVPPMANFTSLNPNIVASKGLQVSSVEGGFARRVDTAAVSSFGIGGTNAHLILERAPQDDRDSAPVQAAEVVLPVSARTEGSRRRMQAEVALFAQAERGLRDASFTLGTGRSVFASRAVAFAGPGSQLAWHEASAPWLALNVSDDAGLQLTADLLGDQSAVSRDLCDAMDRSLAVFDDELAASVRSAAYGRGTSGGAVGRLAQFVIRAALVEAVGIPSLHARRGTDRLLRIARAFVAGHSDARDVVERLRRGEAPILEAEAPGRAVESLSGPLDATLLRRLLASAWVHGEECNPLRFCAVGHRIPMPGYSFEPRRLKSDISWADLRGRAPQPSAPAVVSEHSPGDASPASPADVLRQAWREVLGDEPTKDADFLGSGGDSLSAVRLCSLVEDRLGTKLTVTDVFAVPRFDGIRALLESRKTSASEASPDQVASPLRPEPTGNLPTSPAQQRMYAVCGLQEGTTAYNLASAHRVTGPLHVDRLRAAFQRLVVRHDQLRTSFHLEAGELVQRIHAEVPDIMSVESVTVQEAETRLAEGPRPFDLDVPSLIRVDLLQVTAELHYLIVDMHHIIGDQTSLAVLNEDLTAELHGVALPPVGMAYHDFVRVLEEREAEGGFTADSDFFAELLAQDVPRLELPADRTPPENPSFDGRRHTFTAAAGRETVTRLARQCGATPYMVFLAALGRVLGLHSGQREFLIGTAVSGRTVLGTERTVGMFANTLPLCVADPFSRSVREAVVAARDMALPVLSHQEAPFEAVLASLDIRPGGDTHPLFDVLFNFVTMGTDEFELDGVHLEPLPADDVTSRYDLSFSVAEGADGFSIDVEYRTELFDPSTITRIATHLDRTLSAMADAPDASMGQLDVETADERSARRAALTAPGPVINSSLLQEIRDSFAQHADLPALSWGDDEWSYAEVDRITDTLAGGLQGVGVRHGDFVLCVLERGPWQVFTRLALMKCGAVEIPLGVDVPAARTRETLADSGAQIMVCSNPTAVPRPAGVETYRPEELSGSYVAPGTVTAVSPLIMIYTSGTTGQPKGTLVTHGGILSTCRDNGYMDYHPGDRVLHLTRYTFDPSLLDIYSTFLAGATLCMGGHEVNMDTRLLASFLTGGRINKGILITAVFHLLMAEDPQAVAGMSALYVGGEAMQTWAAQKAYEVMGPGKVFNLYGPTEASVCTTWFRVDEYPEAKRMPIGFPARNRELFIVDTDGTDVPRGVAGELCVAGPSVAIGYHQRPELTGERFAEALGDLPSRVYRTGDSVVLDDRDRIVFIDRVDRQIKHAGYRIELSEIELAIRACEGVTDSMVLHSEQQGVSRLDGFYIGDAAPGTGELRQQLLGRLPEYMVPQRLTRVTRFPLTAHGKIDHARLLVDGTDAPTAGTPPAAPSMNGGPAVADPVILAAFREALGRGDLAGSDDLFRAGAQSIQAIAVTRRLREAGMEVQVSDVYRHPTAETLSAALRPAPAAVKDTDTTVERRPLGAAQLRRMVEWSAEDARRFGESFTDDDCTYTFATGAATRFHVASGADTAGLLSTVAGTSVEDVTRALTALVGRHEVLRTRLVGDRMEVLDPAVFKDVETLVATRDLRDVEADSTTEFVDHLAHALQTMPFMHGLLWRCVIVRLSDTESRLVWAFHHGIFDGFSAGVMGDELTRLARGEELQEAGHYSGFLAGMDAQDDWASELASYDYGSWLAANRALGLAVPGGTGAETVERTTLPLGDADPLGLALVSARRILSGLTGTDDVAVGLVTDCRRWGPDDYTDCLGEFLDVVPILLQEDDDQAAVAARVARVQEHRLHFMHSLSHWRGNDTTVSELQVVYWGDTKKLDLGLLNFQGYIDPDDVPTGSMPGEAPARLQLNAWYDERSLHLELIGTAAAGVNS